METQNLLHSRSAEIPEGLYLELMNKLKLDFDNPTVKTKYVVVDRRIPRTVAMNKSELIDSLIINSKNLINREEHLLKIHKMHYYALKSLCIENRIPTMKRNPRWTTQQELLDEQTENFRNSVSGGGVFHM